MRNEFTITIEKYNDPWFNNGLITFYRLLQEVDAVTPINLILDSNKITFSISDEETFIFQLQRAIINAARLNMIVYETLKVKEGKERKEVKKDFILLQEGRKVDGKVSLKEKIFDEKEAKKFLQSLILSLKSTNMSGKRNICVICGKEYYLNSEVIKNLHLKQSVNPLTTKSKSMSGIRTRTTTGEIQFSKVYFDNICPFCYLIGTLNWCNSSIIYRTFIKKKYSLVFLPIIENLSDLYEFRENYLGLLSNLNRYSNIKVIEENTTVENTEGRYSTLLCFYQKFLCNIQDWEVPCYKWLVLEIPLGSVKNVKRHILEIQRNQIWIIYELNEDSKYIYTDCFKRILFKNENDVAWDITEEIHEKLSKAFLKDNFDEFTKVFLPKKGGYLIFTTKEGHSKKILNDILMKWRVKKMNLGKEQIESIKKVGNIIAKVSINNPTLLYKIDKSRSFQELLDSIRQTSRKIAVIPIDEIKNKITPGALDKLVALMLEKQAEWKEIRNLLVIYASMYLSIEKLKGSEQKNERTQN